MFTKTDVLTTIITAQNTKTRLFWKRGWQGI